MSQDLPRIRQALFVVDKNRNYKFDVNQTITIKGLKKMIVAAANLGKIGLRVFYKGTEYTHLDDSTLVDLFPDLQLVEFTVSIVFNEEDKEENIKLKMGKYCPKHDFKYPYFYCYDCKMSICSICLQSDEHRHHNFIEKYDYLQSSRNLVESLFYDLKDFAPGGKLDQNAYEEIQQKIKVQYYPQLMEMISKIELKQVELLDYFFENEKNSLSNMQKNVSLLKSHCSEGLDKLKHEIAIEDMMLDEEIFITFDRKFRDIATEKTRILSDTKKFDEFKTNLNVVVNVIENTYNDIHTFLKKYLESNVYNEIKEKIKESQVVQVSREDIMDKLLSDIKSRKKAFTGSKFGSSILKSVQRGMIDEKELPPIKPFTPAREGPSGSASGGASNIMNPPQSHPPMGEGASGMVRPPSTKAINVVQESGILIAQCIPGTREVIIYNNSNNTITRQSVDFPSLLGISHFLPNCSFVNVGGKLYISGGLENNAPSNIFFYYDCQTYSITKLSNLLTPRHSHSMFFMNEIIYIVGGNTNATEKFDTRTMKATKLSNMHVEERQNPVLFINNNYIYAFFGLSKGAYLDSVERLNLKQVKSKWEIVAFTRKQKDLDLKMIGCGIIQSGDKEIYMFGGKNKDGLLSTAIKYDFSSNSFDKVDLSLEDGIFFKESILTDLGDHSYGQFNMDKSENFFKIQLG